METINIQLYELCRHDLHLSDGKSLELMNILNQEYKNGVKEDLATLSKQMQAGFDKIDTQFDKIDARFDKSDARFTSQDERFMELDKKIDVGFSELRGDLRVEIKESKVDTIRWVVGLFMLLALMILGIYLKK
jgi:hypothetical protein